MSSRYVNKRLQDMSYDLSLVNVNGTSTAFDTDANGSTSTASPSVAPEAVLNPDDIEAIRTEIAAADLARDNVIKQCRDMQKAAKNAIFALHRGESSYTKSIEMIAGAASKGLVIYDSVMGAYKASAILLCERTLCMCFALYFNFCCCAASQSAF